MRIILIAPDDLPSRTAMSDYDDSHHRVSAGTPCSLGTIAVGQSVLVHEVRANPALAGDLGLRLLELGFVPGEALRVVARGFPGGEPMAVRIGNTTFALRRFEADLVQVVPAAVGAPTS